MSLTRLRRLGLPVAVYTLAAGFITWPLVTQLSTQGAGAGYGDQFEMIRLIWWQQYALQHGLNPFYQSLLGYPQGFFSAIQWAEPLSFWMATPLAFVFGSVAAFNLTLLLEMILNGLAAFYLCWSIGRDETRADSLSNALAALVGGLIFMAFPAVQGHLSGGHLNIVALYGLPIYALCLWRVLHNQAGWQTLAAGALALWITAIGNLVPVYTIFPVTLFLVGYFVLFRRRALLQRRILRNLTLMLSGGALLSLPFFLPLAVQLATPQRTAIEETGWVAFSADLLGFVSPSPFTLWGARLAPAYTRSVLGTNTTEGSAYLGIVAVILGLIALMERKAGGENKTAESSNLGRALRPWLALALGSMLFSLGPLLKWLDVPVVYTLGEYTSHLVMPWALFQSLPIFNATRTPGRFNIVTGLALAVLAAAGLRIVLQRVTRHNLQMGLTTLLLLAILGEYQLFFPFLTTPAAIPPIFYALAKRDDVRAVFDVPWDDPLAAKQALYYQTAHQKPLIAGHVSRRTPVDPAKLNVIEALALSGSDFHTLNTLGVDIVVYHERYMQRKVNPPNDGIPLYQDDQITVYQVPHDSVPPTPDPIVVIGKDGNHSLYAPVDQYATFGFLDGNAHTVELDGQIIAATNGANGLDSVRLKLTKGFHAAKTTPANSSLSFIRGESIDPAKMVTLGSSVSLLNTEVRQLKGSLVLLSVWHAAQKLPGDYHIFVHLIDQDGKIAAQYDGQPGGVAYPTTLWSADQDWSELISLSTADLPPDEYELYTGWYRYPDMQRLPVQAATPHAQDGLIFLQRVRIAKP